MLVCLRLVVGRIGNICIAAPAQAAEAGDWSLILHKVGVAESLHLDSQLGCLCTMLQQWPVKHREHLKFTYSGHRVPFRAKYMECKVPNHNDQHRWSSIENNLTGVHNRGGLVWSTETVCTLLCE